MHRNWERQTLLKEMLSLLLHYEACLMIDMLFIGTILTHVNIVTKNVGLCGDTITKTPLKGQIQTLNISENIDTCDGVIRVEMNSTNTQRLQSCLSHCWRTERTYIWGNPAQL